MQFHPKSGRWICPVSIGETDHTGRAGGARFATTSSNCARPSLSAARIAEIRERVGNGYYNSDVMMGELAQRLLLSGALGG